MVMLRRKLLRDLLHMRGQVLAIALIVASAVSTYVTMRGAYESLLISQRVYYDTYRFADVFASLKRAPESVAQRLREIEGVAAIQTRVVASVVLDVPKLEEPASALLLSLPDSGEPRLNHLHLRRGRLPMNADEVLMSEAFADANSLLPGGSIAAVINSRWRPLRIAGIAITPESVQETRGDAFPDHQRFGLMWMRRHPPGGGDGNGRRVQRCDDRAGSGCVRGGRHRRRRSHAGALRRSRRVRPQRTDLAPLPARRARAGSHYLDGHPGRLPGRGGAAHSSAAGTSRGIASASRSRCSKHLVTATLQWRATLQASAW